MGLEPRDILDMRKGDSPGWVAISSPQTIVEFRDGRNKWETSLFAAGLAVVVGSTALIGLDIPSVLFSALAAYGVGLFASKMVRDRQERVELEGALIQRSDLERRGWRELLDQMDECVQFARTIADSDLVGTLIPENIGESLNAAMWECAQLHLGAAEHPEDQEALDAAVAAHDYLEAAARNVMVTEAEASRLDDYTLPAAPASPFESRMLHDDMAGLRRGIEEVSEHDKRVGD